jgi:hypothetical protein
MTKDYHLTQEQADTLIDDLIASKTISAKDDALNNVTVIINAALDKVLGEPVAYQTPLRYGSKVTHNKPVKPNNWDDDELTEWFCVSLYAPKGLT